MRETLQEKAYNWLLNKIVNRTYAPGMPLKEEIIAKQIKISATPVREALRRLEREGWVENIPYRGCFLKTYTFEEIREIAVLRESIEVSAIPCIITNITDEDWVILDKVIADSEEVVKVIEQKSADVDVIIKRCTELDDLFHSTIIKASHSPKLIEMSTVWNFQLQNYASQKYRHPSFCEVITGGKPQFHWLNEQHRAICTALRLNWGVAAQELMRAHISSISYDIDENQTDQAQSKKTTKAKRKKGAVNEALCC